MQPGLLRRILLAVGLASLALPALPADQHELRAAMVYNIARFVQWPRAALTSANFRLCTVGSGAETDAMTALEGKPLGDQTVAVQAVRRDSELSGCQLIYITADDAVRLSSISEQLIANRAAALTISDAPSFIALGGIVQLVTVNNRQRFRINQALAEKNGLSISAKLLQLALPQGDL
jgi:hypothetical protein